MKEQIEFLDGVSTKVQLLNIKDYPLHTHGDLQIFYVLEGELELTLIYERYILSPGSLHIVHTNDVHSIKSITDSNMVLILSLNSEYFNKIFPHFDNTVFVTTLKSSYFTSTDILKDQIFSIVSEYYYMQPGFESRINNVSVSLVNNLIKNFRGFVIDETDRSFVHKTATDYMQVDRISRIIQEIYTNYPYKISLSEIADREQMNIHYLSRLFHKIVGLNFRDFLSMVRVEASLYDLLSTKKSITQIALDVGFSDAKYYVSQFIRYMGMHPKEYRNLYRNSIFGVGNVQVEELSLSSLKEIIGKYTEYPVFRDLFSIESMIKIDLAAKPTTKTGIMFLNQSQIGNILSFVTHDITSVNNSDFYELYKDINPQESAVNILREFVADPADYRFPPIPLVDSSESISGLMLPNGLKKPNYHMFNLLKRMPRNVLAYGENYISLQGDGEYCIIVFNPLLDDNITVDLILQNIKEIYKLTKYKLVARYSCINFMSQLNFRADLDDIDYENINMMSTPDISFDIIPAMDQYHTSIELDPCDIVFLHFKSN